MKSCPIYKVHKRINCPEITTYMQMVERGKIKACVEQKLLVRYIRKCFATEKLFIDRERLARYLECQQYFPFSLFEWEIFLVALWLCVFKEGGTPRWPELLLLIGRGAGKDALMAFLAFCLTSKINNIKYYNVDICSMAEEQSKRTFMDVYEVLEGEENVSVSKRFKRTLTEIVNRATRSTIKYWTNNPKSKDGLRPGVVFFNEVHAYSDWKNISVFTGALGKVKHPRRIYATTDGDVREGVLDSLKEKARQVLTGEMSDNGFLPFVCKLDDVSEVDNEKMWPKANPSLVYMPVLLEEMQREYNDYKNDPITHAAFMTKRMNIPQGNKDIEVTSWSNILKASLPIGDMSNKPCVCGIDFARTTDFISAFLLFRDGDGYAGIHHSWYCTHCKDAGRIKAPLDEWERKGILTIVDDVEISPELITGWVFDQSLIYDVKKIAIDDYRHTLFMKYLRNIGFEAKEKQVKLVRPSDVMRVQPLINSLFATGRIKWGDDPMMRWYTNNSKLEAAPNGNFKYGKIEPKSRKTDGFTAFVAAMCLADEIPEYIEPVFMDAFIFS